jgi:3-phenylpropionate/trans-cinnamate dioxygenase ferredoxin reductase subunit
MRLHCPISVRHSQKSTWQAHSTAIVLLFRHAAHYAEHGVMLRLGFPVVSLDHLRRRVEIADGSALEYDALLLATGSHPRPLLLPGAELAGVHYLRTVADVDRLRTELTPGRRAVIIGGGYIGLEVAATCREAGQDVVVPRGRRPRDETGGGPRGLAIL